LAVRSGDEQGVGKSSFTLLDWRVPSDDVPLGPNDDDVVLEEQPDAEEEEEEGGRDDDSASDDAEEYTHEATEV
jgi:hypothetical protein